MPERVEGHHSAWSWDTRLVGAGVVMVAAGWLALFFSFRDGAPDRESTSLIRWRVVGAICFVAGTVVCLLAR
jgi:hypothetical protein